MSRYKTEIAAARDRLARSERLLANTAAGPVEYVTFGRGSPVLWVHGVVGGSDQGRAWSQAFLGQGFQLVAVSRFGYLGSPRPTDSSPSAQADAYAALLDTLDIDKTAVVASSAGTASALRFAVRHPARCAALVLWSMAVPPYDVPPRAVRAMLRAYFGSDFVFWMTFALIHPIGRRLMGIPRNVDRNLSAEDRRFVENAWHSFLPVSTRADGIMNDICVSNPDLNVAQSFDSLEIRTLVIHARDDPWGSFAGAQQIAARIPGARFEAVQSGGHLLLGHQASVRALIAAFIRGNETDEAAALSSAVVGDARPEVGG